MTILKNFTGYMLGPKYRAYKPGDKLTMSFIDRAYPTFNLALAHAYRGLKIDFDLGYDWPGYDKIYQFSAPELDEWAGIYLNPRAETTVGDVVWFFARQRPILPAVAASRAKQLAETQRINRLLDASLRYHDKTI